MSSRFFARQEHHLQYYLLKFADNEVRIYCVVIMMAIMMSTSLDSRFSSPKNLGKKIEHSWQWGEAALPISSSDTPILSFRRLGESRKNPSTHHKESNLWSSNTISELYHWTRGDSEKVGKKPSTPDKESNLWILVQMLWNWAIKDLLEQGHKAGFWFSLSWDCCQAQTFIACIFIKDENRRNPSLHES